jgi:hypothetical protein
MEAGRATAWWRPVVLAVFLVAWGPCGPITGGRLSGTPATPPADGWAFTDDISTIQVETRPDEPYSVTTWCVSDGPTLWVPSRGAEKKPWVQNVLADPRVRLRIGTALYDLRATRVTDAAEQAKVVGLLRAKYRMARWGMDADPALSPGTWYFRMEGRETQHAGGG